MILYRAGWSIVIPILFLALGGYLAAYTENEIILPRVTQVFDLFAQPWANLISMGSLATKILVNLTLVMTGYFLAILIAVPLGVLMEFYGTVLNLLNGFLALFVLSLL